MCSRVSLCLPLLGLISTDGCGATKWDCSHPRSSDSHLPSNPTRTVRLTFDMPPQTGATSFITWMWGVMIGGVVGGRGVLGVEELLKGKEAFMYMYKTCRQTEKNLVWFDPDWLAQSGGCRKVKESGLMNGLWYLRGLFELCGVVWINDKLSCSKASLYLLLWLRLLVN